MIIFCFEVSLSTTVYMSRDIISSTHFLRERDASTMIIFRELSNVFDRPLESAKQSSRQPHLLGQTIVTSYHIHALNEASCEHHQW